MNAGQRFIQAHYHAVRLANDAYEKGKTNEERADLYYRTYRREMAAFYQLEAMRRPLPHQSEIDRESAELLRES